MSKKIVFVKELTKYLTNFYSSKENLNSIFIKKEGVFSTFERVYNVKIKNFEPLAFLGVSGFLFSLIFLLIGSIFFSPSNRLHLSIIIPLIGFSFAFFFTCYSYFILKAEEIAKNLKTSIFSFIKHKNFNVNEVSELLKINLLELKIILKFLVDFQLLSKENKDKFLDNNKEILINQELNPQILKALLTYLFELILSNKEHFFELCEDLKKKEQDEINKLNEKAEERTVEKIKNTKIFHDMKNL